MDYDKRIEKYNQNCDLFAAKMKQLVNKEVEEIKIHMDEFPEISFFVGCDLVTNNYAQTICKQLNREYGLEFICCENPLEPFSMTLRILPSRL